MKSFYLKTKGDIKNMLAWLGPKVKGEEFGVHVKVELGKRTPKQNAAIHVYCGLLADELNDAGLYLVVPGFKKDFKVTWTGDMVKENIWRRIQIALLDIESTTDLDRAQVSQVYEIIARNMSMNYSVSVPFPQNRYPDD